MLTWGDSPMASKAPPDWGSKILHGRITVGNTELIGGDVFPNTYEQPGFAVLLNVDDAVGAERIFHALAENGKLSSCVTLRRISM